MITAKRLHDAAYKASEETDWPEGLAVDKFIEESTFDFDTTPEETVPLALAYGIHIGLLAARSDNNDDKE